MGAWSSNCTTLHRLVIQKVREFEGMVGNLILDAKARSSKVIDGDLNVLEWRSKENNEKGRSVFEAFAQLDVILVKDGEVNTLRKKGSGSVIDLVFLSPKLVRRISWHICKANTLSEYQKIIFEL